MSEFTLPKPGYAARIYTIMIREESEVSHLQKIGIGIVDVEFISCADIPPRFCLDYTHHFGARKLRNCCGSRFCREKSQSWNSCRDRTRCTMPTVSLFTLNSRSIYWSGYTAVTTAALDPTTCVPTPSLLLLHHGMVRSPSTT